MACLREAVSGIKKYLTCMYLDRKPSSRRNCVHVCTYASGMHFLTMSAMAYPSRKRQVEGGRLSGGYREKTYRIYHLDKTRGKQVGFQQTRSHQPFRGSEFSYTHGPCLPSPPHDDGKWHYGYSICFFAHTLITPRTGNAARYFVSAGVMNTDDDDDDDRDACLESANVSFIIRSPHAKSASRIVDVSPCRLLRMSFCKNGENA